MGKTANYKNRFGQVTIILVTCFALLLSGCGSHKAQIAGEASQTNSDAAAARDADTSTAAETKTDTAPGTETSIAAETKAPADYDGKVVYDSEGKDITAEVCRINAAVTTPFSALPEVGSTLHGFRVESIDYSRTLDAVVYSVKHEKSGADLIYIQNTDPNAAFSIGYRTPTVDGSDTNHVFEHAILSGSGKYPGRDVFFELCNKTYSTYVNALTTPAFTVYPLSSLSEVQLKKMMDVYMSCMVDSDVLRDEYIFRREALRYALRDPEEEITMTGTVFAEDLGYLSDTGASSAVHVLETLYPDSIARFSVGTAALNFRELTYEQVLKTYERAYHFDNSLILLYGDMDASEMLSFLDRDYLAQAPEYHTDLSAWDRTSQETGFKDVKRAVPASTGDRVENAGIINYAFDASAFSQEERAFLSLLFDIENKRGSVFERTLIKHGLSNNACMSVEELQNPVIFMTLENASYAQKDAFAEAVRETIDILSKEGEAEAVIESLLHQKEMQMFLTRETASIGTDILFDVYGPWAETGRTDGVLLRERAFENLKKDPDQFIRDLFRRIKGTDNSALVSSVPEPGLLEQLEEERRQYLKEMKASMTKAEVEALIRETEAFDLKNRTETPPNAVSIPLSALPEYKQRKDHTEEKSGDIRILSAPLSQNNVGEVTFLFDASQLNSHDQLLLELALLLIGECDTETHSIGELRAALPLSLYGMHVGMETINRLSEGRTVPVLNIGWIYTPETLADGLMMMEELFTETDYSDTARVLQVIGREAGSRCIANDPGPDLAVLFAQAACPWARESTAYLADRKQSFYPFLIETAEKLSRDPACGAELNRELRSVVSRVFCRGAVDVLLSGSEKSLESTKAQIRNAASELPLRDETGEGYIFPEVSTAHRQNYIVETAVSNHAMVSPWPETLPGRLVPYINVLNDRYFIPGIRFENGAYGGAIRAGYGKLPYIMANVYSDPHPEKNLRMYDAGRIREVLEAPIDEDTFSGAVLGAFADMNPPAGEIAGAMSMLRARLEGVDIGKKEAFINDIREASLSDRKRAAEQLPELFRSGITVNVSNASHAERIRELVDSTTDLRRN